MKVCAKDSETVFFRQQLGRGSYGGVRFDFCVAMSSNGEVVGIPIIHWQNGPTVVVEVEDLIPLAYKAAFGEGE